MTLQSPAKQEFIGRPVQVTDASADPTLAGLTGVVVDETRNTLVVQADDGREVRVPKSGQVFRIEFNNETVELEGGSIAFAPEDRTKKAR